MPRPDVVPASLVRLKTRDGVWLDGVVNEPKPRPRTALVLVHGLGSVFSSAPAMTRELSARLNAAAIGYFKFNTRGHDIVARGGRRLAGAAYERFVDCVEDIRVVLAFVRQCGYRRVVLAGHSTGANKVLYYASRSGDRRVVGIVLLGPVADSAAEAKRLGRRELRRRVASAQRIARRDPESLVPRAWGYWSARRYISLYRPGEVEDVFPYYRPGARWTAFRAVRLPVAAILGSRDEFLDRPAREVIETFRENATRAAAFTGAVIPGARHGFQRRERVLADMMVRWIRDL